MYYLAQLVYTKQNTQKTTQKMTSISSRIINLQSTLRFSCTVLLKSSTAATTRNIPWCALQSSSFHMDKSIKTHVKKANLFSADSKKTKKNKEDGTKITRKVKSSLEKTTWYYTKEQDELILARVNKMGYDNPNTWKSLAVDFNIKSPNTIKRRCDLLLRRGSGSRQRRTFTKEEDALILQKVEEMGYGDMKTWKTLAHELDRDPTPSSIQVIKRRYDLIANRNMKGKKNYSEEDDNLILSYVEKNGKSKTTWQELAAKLGMDHPNSIKQHYNLLLENYVKGRFTKKEDKVIVSDVEIHGNNLETFKKLCKKLNRINPNPIKQRFEYLENKPSKKQSHWGINEDQLLMQHILQVHH